MSPDQQDEVKDETDGSEGQGFLANMGDANDNDKNDESDSNGGAKPIDVIAHETFYLKADQPKVNHKDRYEAKPDEEAIADHIPIVVVEMRHNAIFYVSALSQMQDYQIGSEIGDEPHRCARQDTRHVPCLQAHQRHHWDRPPNHPVEQADHHCCVANGPRGLQESRVLIIELILFFDYLLHHLQN